MDMSIFRKFSENLKKVLVTAERIAREQNTVMDTEHQLLALLMIKGTLAFEILTSFNISADRIQLVAALVSKKITASAPDGLSNNAKEVIQQAVAIASKFGHYSVDTEHLLLALLSNKKSNAYAVIERIEVKPSDLVNQIETIFGGIQETLNSLSNGSPENTLNAKGQGEPFTPPEFDVFGPMNSQFNELPPNNQRVRESMILSYATNMTKQAVSKKLDPVVGRSNETERLIQILCRRTKNNPILIGEPGIGKTSIVEGLAQRIIDGQVPTKLSNKEILSIDMGSLLAGTMYRGQFESRVKKLLAEIKKHGNAILFIDEIHTVVGAGSTEGSIDAANLLKPMLARGELRLIGSTTIDEYKKYIEKDPAFERRFQPILVKEPTEVEAIEILKGIKERYEKFHRVKYTKEAIEAAVLLSKRYINDRNLPDKAIDLIDEAAAATNIVSVETTQLAKLKKELQQILHRKESLIINEEYESATKLRTREIQIEEQIRKIKQKEKSVKPEIITVENIARVVSRWTGVPVNELSLIEKRKLLDLEKRLKKHIIGQDEAIAEVARVIKRARVGISNPNRPNGSFIFLGPTGVGKSELAKVMAEEILGDRENLIKIDMSEFMERHNLSRLIGSPAGYVGYEEGGKLTEAVRRNPYSVILLDEIEKAHPEVFNFLLQIMEDGHLTDARGRKIDFTNTILVMTSNLGTSFFEKQSLIGFSHDNSDESHFEQMKEKIMDSLKQYFKPEFLNRVEKTIIFKALNHETIREIAKLQLKQLSDRVAKQKIRLNFDRSVSEWIAKRGFDPEYGARPLRKVISDFLEAPISEAILNEEYQSGDIIVIEVRDDNLMLQKPRPKKTLTF